MASFTLMQTKDGKPFYKIAVSRGRGKSPFTMRWYIPDKWSQRAVDRELSKVAADFELKCSRGEVLTRSEQKQKEAEARIEAAKLKTFEQYVNGVYIPAKSLSWAETSRTNAVALFRKHILPVLGQYLINDITPAMLSKLLTDRQRQGASHSSLTILYIRLNNVFAMAFDDDTIPANPMLKVKRPASSKESRQNKREADKAYTVEELRYILSCADQEPLQWQTYIYLAADTGARKGELLGLQWADIDWQNRRVTISRNVQYTPAKGNYVAAPKNGLTRNVDIGDQTLGLLKKLRQAQADRCISQWVFTHSGTSEVMFPRSPGKYFEKFGKRYGIQNFHPHILRHTSASIAITQGADIVSVSQRLGHKDSSTTLRMYAHANEESIRRAGQTVRDALKVSGK